MAHAAIQVLIGAKTVRVLEPDFGIAFFLTMPAIALLPRLIKSLLKRVMEPLALPEMFKLRLPTVRLP